MYIIVLLFSCMIFQGECYFAFIRRKFVVICEVGYMFMYLLCFFEKFLIKKPFYHLTHVITLGLVDEQQKVRTITALAIAALAEAATPYGIESFDSVLKPLWKGIKQHRGKVRCLIL